MEIVEGGGHAPPRRSLLAYAEAVGDEEQRRESGLRQDSADGDVVETSSAAEDILLLRRQLDDREQQNERARLDALQLRSELEAVRAESAALRESVAEQRAAPAPVDPETASRIVSDAFTELAKVRSESFKARVELEKERNAHRAEILRARGQFNSAQDELQRLIKVRRASPQPATYAKAAPALTNATPATTEVRGAKLPGALAVLALVLLVAMLWARASRSSQAAIEAPAHRAEPAESAPGGLLPLTPAARAQFQGAVGRLSRVLAARSGHAPEELLRQAHELYKDKDPSLCSFDWRNGQPSLLYSGGHLSLGQTIQRCADAIEKIP